MMVVIEYSLIIDIETVSWPLRTAVRWFEVLGVLLRTKSRRDESDYVTERDAGKKGLTGIFLRGALHDWFNR